MLDKYQPVQAIQVCATGLDQLPTRNREIAGLTECMHECGLEEGEIVTLDHEELVELPDGKKVRMTPIYRWLR